MRFFGRLFGESIPPEAQPKSPEQIKREDLTGLRVRIKGTQYAGVVVGPATQKRANHEGVHIPIRDSWVLRLDGNSGEDFVYESGELEVLP